MGLVLRHDLFHYRFMVQCKAGSLSSSKACTPRKCFVLPTVYFQSSTETEIPLTVSFILANQLDHVMLLLSPYPGVMQLASL